MTTKDRAAAGMKISILIKTVTCQYICDDNYDLVTCVTEYIG